MAPAPPLAPDRRGRREKKEDSSKSRPQRTGLTELSLPGPALRIRSASSSAGADRSSTLTPCRGAGAGPPGSRFPCQAARSGWLPLLVQSDYCRWDRSIDAVRPPQDESREDEHPDGPEDVSDE